MPLWPRGFYAVLDRDDESLARALAAHASVLQVRVKPATTDDIVRVARMARRVCSDAGIPLVINDRVDIALAVGADGVHLGQTDMPIADARALAGDALAIGLSTHNPQQVADAIDARPSYIAYGPVFATTTKDNPDPTQGLEALRDAVAQVAASGLAIPTVAIGGITPDRAAEVYATGVTAACAISAVNRAPDVAAAARSLHNRRAPIA
jgi:thiamine-phosphate pyrophosphorylase